MAKKPSTIAPDDDAPEGDDGADPLMMVPLELVASSGDAAAEDILPDPAADADDSEEAPDGVSLEDEIVVTAARRGFAEEAGALMGDEVDPDGVSVDVIDAGNELLMWALSPSPDRVAVAPDIDMSHPEDWLLALGELDLPVDIEAAIERLAKEAAAGDEPRARFVAALGALFAEAGIETLAVRRDGGDGGFDWVALSSDDLARERDGEPWAPAGDDDGVTFRPIGVALGMGGRLSLWPQGPSDAPDAAIPVKTESEPAVG